MVKFNGDSAQFQKAVSKLKNMKVGVEIGADAIVEASGGTFFSFMQRVAAESYRETKWYIKEGAVTPTGIRRGSPRGRYDTGAMYDAFVGTLGGGSTGKGKYKFQFEMGWLKGMPGYTLFQEFGTVAIKGMEALAWGQQALDDNMEAELSWTVKQFQRQAAEGMRAAIVNGGKIPKSKLNRSVAIQRREYGESDA